MKIFSTCNIEINRNCHDYLSIPSAHDQIVKRKRRFLLKYIEIDNNI